MTLDITVTAAPANGQHPLQDQIGVSAAAGQPADIVAVGVPAAPPPPDGSPAADIGPGPGAATSGAPASGVATSGPASSGAASSGTPASGAASSGSGSGAAPSGAASPGPSGAASWSAADFSSSGGAGEIASFLPGGTADLLARYDASGAPGEVTEVAADLGTGLARVLLLGTGDGSPAAMRQAGAALARRVKRGATAVASVTSAAPPESTRAFTEGLLLASYRYSLKSAVNGEAEKPPATVTLLVPDGETSSLTAAAAGPPAASPVEHAVATAEAVALARDLVNTPSAVKTPEWLASRATDVAGQCALGIRVRDRDELESGGFGGILAVGSGSARPPRLIELSYRPESWNTHVVLVGKGITFDSGGLSLKPNDGMKLMKTDMAGGAVVIAVMSVLARLAAPVRVTGLVAAAENMPSGSAMRPGDVITHYGGRTVEVLNTDAEGRLVLADALAYADTTLDPDFMVDVATLTGAARIALGTKVGAMFTGDDDLAAALAAAGDASGEPLWRLPMAGDYRDALDSQVADLANIGTRDHGGAGAILAALFLREFSGGRRWAHLDIAGPARAGADDAEVTKGGTGFGTRVLLSWLAGLS